METIDPKSNTLLRIIFIIIIIIRLEDRLPPNIGFALERDLAVFTHSAITLLKVNQFG